MVVIWAHHNNSFVGTAGRQGKRVCDEVPRQEVVGNRNAGNVLLRPSAGCSL